MVAKSVLKYASEVLILNLPHGKDVTEWLEGGGSIEHLLEFVVNGEHVKKVEKPTLTELKSAGHYREKQWPQISENAFYGLAGEIVKAIIPHTEADPAAILINVLTAFGNCIGNSPHFKVERTQHALKLFSCLVGESSKGRKGTSWSTVEYLFQQADPTWEKDNIIYSALSSGEGLINHLRDTHLEEEDSFKEGQIESVIPLNKVIGSSENDSINRFPALSETIALEARSLFIEEEFAVVLKRMAMDNNSLSGILRQAWDKKSLRTLTKHSPLLASNTHISVIGHITQADLLKYLKDNEMANGFGNRFLWLMTKRSKLIPNPKGTPDFVLLPLARKLSDAISKARTITEIIRSAEAESWWEEHYAYLSRDRYGLTGSLLNRAEAQVMRIACIHSLINMDMIINTDHLNAAIAFWEYCEDSTHYIFGERTGNSVADVILEALKSRGPMSKDDINNLFGKNKSAQERNHALNFLIKLERIKEEFISDTGGCPKTIYQLIQD